MEHAEVASDAMRARPDRDYRPENRQRFPITPTPGGWDPSGDRAPE